MNPVLVAYATSEGQTRKIARLIADRIRSAGHDVDFIDTAAAQTPLVSPVYIGAVLGASLHETRHQSSFVHFVKSNASWLSGIPSAVFSVSLVMASKDEDSQRETHKLLAELLEDTGLDPALTRCVAGALRYTRYNYLKRMLIRLIAKHEGGPTDTSQDYELTDWDDVAAFVDEFLQRL